MTNIERKDDTTTTQANDSHQIERLKKTKLCRFFKFRIDNLEKLI